ncbi:non-ribosomal peptide synthetase, partial [Bacillus pseudomycoides]|uniref:condensation domain-containing protein n=1 Tax=Bacillus pseudomycoides TaxID=64104 RepID=UPI000BED4C92
MGEVKIESVRPLFPMQEGILFHHLLNSEDNAYFEQLSFSVRGELNLRYLEQSFNELIRRYDALRTVFIYEDLEKPLQVILKERKGKIQFEDILHLNNTEQDRYIKKYQERDREIGFDLQSDLLIRMSVLQTGSQLFQVILSHHHILMDGWCFRVVLKELFEIYAQLKQGVSLKLSPVFSCDNYIEWLEKQDRQKANAYWQEYLYGLDNGTSIPKQKKSDLRNFHENEYFIIDRNMTEKLYEISSFYKVTLNHLFQAAWGVLLQNYNSTEDVVFGTVVSGRPSEVAGIEKMVGLFINTIPVRVTCQKNMSFKQLLLSIKESALASTPYHNALLAEIQANSVQQQRVFDHILSFQNFSHDNEEEIMEFDNQHGLIFSEFEAFEQTNYDFTLMVGVGKELNVKIIYDTGKYETGFICKIGVHLRRIFEQIIADPEQLISNIGLVDEEDKQQILSSFNNTKAAYPQDCT